MSKFCFVKKKKKVFKGIRTTPSLEIEIVNQPFPTFARKLKIFLRCLTEF